MKSPSKFQGINITRSNMVRVQLPQNESARISFYEKGQDKIQSFIGNYAEYPTTSPEDITVCITGHHKISYIDFGRSHVEYIQNDVISGIKSYSSKRIKIGSSVTEERKSGDVDFEQGIIKIKAEEVEIHSGTTIEKGVEFVVEPI